MRRKFKTFWTKQNITDGNNENNLDFKKLLKNEIRATNINNMVEEKNKTKQIKKWNVYFKCSSRILSFQIYTTIYNNEIYLFTYL